MKAIPCLILAAMVAVPSFASKLVWVQRAQLQQPISGIAAVEWNGKILVTGGTSGMGDVMRETRIYDPSSDSWIFGPQLNIGRRFHAMASVDGTPVVIGGEDPSGFEMSSTERFDGSNWQNLALAPSLWAVTWLGAAAIGSDIYAVGGKAAAAAMCSNQKWNFYSAGWDNAGSGSLMTCRAGVAVVEMSGNLYAIGGASLMGAFYKDVEEFNPGLNYWVGKTAMISARMHHAAVVWKGKIYVSGGEQGSGPMDSVEVYDPGTNSWSQETPMPEPKLGHAMVVCRDRLFVIGGGSGGGPSAAVYEGMEVDLGRVKGDTIVPMPNYIEAGKSRGGIRFFMRGDPGAKIEFFIYNMAGRKVYEQTGLAFDGDGLGIFEPDLFGGMENPIFVPGTYLAVMRYGGVVARAPFIILAPRGNK